MKDLKYDGSAGSYFALNIQDFFVEYIIKQHLLIINIYIYIYTNNPRILYVEGKINNCIRAMYKSLLELTEK